MTRKTEYEYIVVGLGGIGSAAAYWLARRAGAEVLGLEQFELGHDKGASEDHSRIIRLTYHTSAYVELAHHAYTHWHVLEDDANEAVLTITGDLLLGPRESEMPVTDYADSLAGANVQFEMLDADEIMHRWPQWRLHADVHASFQARGGIVMAAKATRLHATQARRHGATLLEHTQVLSISPDATGIEVRTTDATYRCRRLVLAADAWTNGLLEPLGVSLPLTLTEENVIYFASPHLDEFVPERFPVWIYADDPNFYGVPVHGDIRAVKAAQDMCGREITLESRTFEPDGGVIERVGAFLQAHLPRAYGPVLQSKTCMYTLTPDRDFVIDCLPAHPQIAIALGAGHAFKFAGLIGRVLSDLSIDGVTEFDISPFAFSRPILHMGEPPTNFLLRREAPRKDSASLPR
jgi:sarcosine oxidase